MSLSAAGTARHLALLVRLSGERLRGTTQHPTAGFLIGVGLPALVVGSALWMLGGVGVLDAAGADGGLTLGVLIAGPVAFMGYGTLFGASDDHFLRRLGIRPAAIFWERALRLGAVAAALVAGSLVPFVAAGAPTGRPLTLAAGSALLTWGAAAASLGWAARAVARPGGGPAWLSVGMRQWDPGLARAAPLVYAPLLPFLLGAAYGAFAGAAPGIPWGRALAALPAALLGVALGARLYASSAPRFLARASEMAFSPPPAAGGEAFRVGRGLSRLLPRASGAAWVRDAAVAGRRFGWASRVTWPVAVAAIVALARWGELPSTRVWVLAAAGIALAVQAAAVVGLGGLERHGRRWLDRSLGLTARHRFLGRWAWAWGLSLWLLVPVALAWHWWSGSAGAWIWPLAGAFSAGVATTASLLLAERR